MSKKASCIFLVAVMNGFSLGMAYSHSEENKFPLCNDKQALGLYLLEATQNAHDECEVHDIRRALFQIATKCEDRMYCLGAVRALVEITPEHEMLQGILLDILAAHPKVNQVRQLAARAFVYVAGDDARAELRRRVERGHPSTLQSDESWALVELGDAAYGDFLERCIQDSNRDDRNYFFAVGRMKRIRLQSSLSLLLNALGEGTESDASWIMHQAIRHGATRDQMRQATRSYLRKMDQQSPDRYFVVAMIERTQLFVGSELNEFPMVQTLMARLKRSSDVFIFPPGALRLEALQNEFYGLDRFAAEGGREDGGSSEPE